MITFAVTGRSHCGVGRRCTTAMFFRIRGLSRIPRFGLDRRMIEHDPLIAEQISSRSTPSPTTLSRVATPHSARCVIEAHVDELHSIAGRAIIGLRPPQQASACGQESHRGQWLWRVVVSRASRPATLSGVLRARRQHQTGTGCLGAQHRHTSPRRCSAIITSRIGHIGLRRLDPRQARWCRPLAWTTS